MAVKPPIPITDRRFVYRNSNNTDVRATFERARRELKQEPKAAPADPRAKPINYLRACNDPY